MPAVPSPAEPHVRGRRDPRGERRRAELLDAAIRLIGAQGLDAVTHRAVATAAGVPPATPSYYFRSKDDLIDEALRLVADREIERLREFREALGDAPGDDVGSWVEGIAAWLEEQLEGDGRIALLAQYHLQLEGARRPELTGVLRSWAAATHGLAEEALSRLGAPDPSRGAILLVCAIDGLRLEAVSAAGTRLRGAELRALLERLLRSLVASPVP
jgi:TetR/AcrR family transcriptional regulator, regulator of biofilm formation and stress response